MFLFLLGLFFRADARKKGAIEWLFCHLFPFPPACCSLSRACAVAGHGRRGAVPTGWAPLSILSVPRGICYIFRAHVCDLETDGSPLISMVIW